MKHLLTSSAVQQSRRVLATLLFASGLVFGQQQSLTTPNAIHVAFSPTQGIEVDYTPESGAKPYYYPGQHVGCPGGVLTMIDLNRTSLEYKSTGCFGANDNSDLQSYLSRAGKNDLLLASTDPSSALGSLNLAPIGGTDFTQKNAPVAYSYSIVGYGQAGAGLATEAYTTIAGAHWPGINGQLVKVGSAAGVYGIQTTDPVGFAVVNQDGRTPSIVIGNPSTFDTGAVGLVNPGTPSGFTSVTYTAPPANGGGVWLLILDRHSLQQIWSLTFPLELANGSANNIQVTNLYEYLGTATNDDIVFITSLPGVEGLYTQPDPGDYATVLDMIQRMGVSPNAFNRAMTWQTSLGTEGGNFSMVGIANNFLGFPSSSAAPCSSIPGNSTLVCGGNTSQWFSSSLDTQQNETGSLQGSLVRDKSFRYAPINVTPFDVNSLGEDTPDALLAPNLPLAIGHAPAVPFPSFTGPQAQAYSWLSNWLANRAFYKGYSACNSPSCYDIRSYYTGDQIGDLFDVSYDFSQLAYPGSASFDANSFKVVQDQLLREIQCMQNVSNFQNDLNTINGQTGTLFAIDLSVAANDVSSKLNIAMNSGAANTQMKIAEDALDASSAFVGGFGNYLPAANVLSGILKGTSELLTLDQDANGSSAQPPTLAQLMSTANTEASQTAATFASNLFNGTNTFFNGVYGDWFKLQTVGLLTANPTSTTGWYLHGLSSDDVLPGMVASARKNFYLQLLGQYFGTNYVTDAQYVQTGPKGTNWTNSWPNLATFQSFVGESVDMGYEGLNLSSLSDYSWDVRDTLGANDGNWTYNFVVLKSNPNVTWPSSLGDILMGSAVNADGTGDLNLNRDMLYDSSTFPQISTTDFHYWWTTIYVPAEACDLNPVCSGQGVNY